MPDQKTYTNRDVENASRKRLGVTIEQPTAATPADPDAARRAKFSRVPYLENADPNQLLREAHGSLDRANGLEQETDAQSLLSIPTRLNTLAIEAEQAQKYSGQRALRAFLRPSTAAGSVAGTASILPTPLRPALFAASKALLAPDIIRRMVYPDKDESRGWAAAEGALLNSDKLLGGAKRLIGAIRAPSRARATAQAAQEARAVARNTWGTRFSSDVASPIQENAPVVDPSMQHFVDMAQRVAGNYGRSKAGLSPRPLSVAMQALPDGAPGTMEEPSIQALKQLGAGPKPPLALPPGPHVTEMPRSSFFEPDTVPVSTISQGAQEAARGRAVDALQEAPSPRTLSIQSMSKGALQSGKKRAKDGLKALKSSKK